MKIALLGPAAPRDLLGSEAGVPVGLVGTPVTALARALVNAGHEVTVVTLSPDVRTRWAAHGAGVRIVVGPFRTRARDRALDFFRIERRFLKRAVKEINADVVHAHWTYEYALAALHTGTPCLVTAHDAPATILRYLPDAYRLLRFGMAVAVRARMRALTTVSPYLRSRWRTQMLYRRPVSVIPNIAPELPSTTSVRSSTPVVIDIADSTGRKNIDTLVRAFAMVRDQEPTAELRLIGRGLGPEDDFARSARAAGLDAGVKFLGEQSRKQIADHLAESWVLCHTALEESQGMCLLEAMAAGVPIIAGNDSGGIHWTTDGGKAACLVDVRSASAVAERLVDIINRPDSQADRVDRATWMLRDRYSPTSVANAYVREYESLIAGKGSR